jgi:hypothetical protein
VVGDRPAFAAPTKRSGSAIKCSYSMRSGCSRR